MTLAATNPTRLLPHSPFSVGQGEEIRWRGKDEEIAYQLLSGENGLGENRCHLLPVKIDLASDKPKNSNTTSPSFLGSNSILHPQLLYLLPHLSSVGEWGLGEYLAIPCFLFMTKEYFLMENILLLKCPLERIRSWKFPSKSDMTDCGSCNEL